MCRAPQNARLQVEPGAAYPGALQRGARVVLGEITQMQRGPLVAWIEPELTDVLADVTPFRRDQEIHPDPELSEERGLGRERHPPRLTRPAGRNAPCVIQLA